MPFPITDTVYKLFTSDNEIKKFRSGIVAYLTAQGLPAGSPAHQILVSVPLGGTLTKADADNLANLIVAEVNAGTDGPVSVRRPFDLHLLRAIHEKFVQLIDVDWAKCIGLNVALSEELFAQKVFW